MALRAAREREQQAHVQHEQEKELERLRALAHLAALKRSPTTPMSSRVSPASLSPATVLRTRLPASLATQLASPSGCTTFDNMHAPQTQQGEPGASINGAESEVLAYMTRQKEEKEEDSQLIYWQESVCFDVCPT